MYVRRTAEEIYKAAVLAEAIPLIDNLEGWTIKGLANRLGVSEKQLHRWKALLREEGLKLFSTLRPGRRKKEVWKSYTESEHLLIYETINRLLIETQRDGETNRKFSPGEKQMLLSARARLKSQHGLTYEQFSQLIGIDSGSLRLWARQVREDGTDGLQNKSRAPKRCANKLPDVLITKIVWYGTRWRRRHRGLRITEFSDYFRFKYRRLLRQLDKSNLSDKVIARYLKQAGLYQGRKERLKGHRGGFRYYFPGAQSIIDTSTVVFLGVRLKLITVLDAFSRNILYQEGFLNETAEMVIRVLSACLKVAGRNGLKLVSVLSDHGRVYKSGKVRQYLKQHAICRNLAAPYRPEGKAALERYFRTVKKALSSKGKLIHLFFNGIFLWLKIRLVKTVFNLILLGYTGQHNQTKTTANGKSPQERLTGMVRPQFQESVRRVLQAEERNSELKNELIDRLYQEFFSQGVVKKTKVKGYLSGFRKETIRAAAEALRRKLVVEDLPVRNRWWYLSKVACNIEKKTQEEEVSRARQVILQEQMNVREQEEMARIEEEKRWDEQHPESALEKAVGWYLLLCNSTVARGYYQREIIRITGKLLGCHSILTAGLKMKKLCERINAADGSTINTDRVKQQGMILPAPSEMEKAKDDLIKHLKKRCTRRQETGTAVNGIENLQNLRTLWTK